MMKEELAAIPCVHILIIRIVNVQRIFQRSQNCLNTNWHLKQRELHPKSSSFCSFKFIIHSSPTEQKCTSLHWRIQGPHCSVWRRGETVVGLFAQMHHECVMVFKNFFSALCVFSWLNLRTWSPSIRWPSRTSTASSPRQSWTRSNTHTGPISPLQSCNFITWHWPHNKDYVF